MKNRNWRYFDALARHSTVRLVAIASSICILAGCSGKIYTVKNPEFVDGMTEGVLFYGYKPVEKKIILDRIRHAKTGDITHSSYEPSNSAKYCRPQVKKVTVAEPDYNTVYAVKYDPQLFETSKFSVELDKGMLKSVNSESTPGPKSAVESLQGLVDVRSSIQGAVDAADDAAAEIMAANIIGTQPHPTPITCSASK